MSDTWRDHLVGLLKYLEKSRSDFSKIHDFRRGLESCNSKKAERILPQFFEIYNQCKEHFDDDFNSWLATQSFSLKLGQRHINLYTEKNIDEYAQNLKWTFSSFDPTLAETNSNTFNTPTRGGTGLPVSNKQLKMAMRRMHGMNSDQLSNMATRVPQGQLDSLASNPAAEEIVTKLKSDKRAQAVADKIKNIQKKE
ncbi:hypothetical protein BH23THE1_BH23THE1_33530 [soil metagenome]